MSGACRAWAGAPGWSGVKAARADQPVVIVLFDDVRAPKYVAPFDWGGSASERMTSAKFLATVERVLPRRNVEVTDAMRSYLQRAFDWLTQ